MDHANPSLSPEGWPVNLLAPRPATRDLGWCARREIERGLTFAPGFAIILNDGYILTN